MCVGLLYLWTLAVHSASMQLWCNENDVYVMRVNKSSLGFALYLNIHDYHGSSFSTGNTVQTNIWILAFFLLFFYNNVIVFNSQSWLPVWLSWAGLCLMCTVMLMIDAEVMKPPFFSPCLSYVLLKIDSSGLLNDVAGMFTVQARNTVPL